MCSSACRVDTMKTATALLLVASALTFMATSAVADDPLADQLPPELREKPGRYQLGVDNTGLVAWRLDTMTGELIVCRAIGKTEETGEAKAEGAGCWMVAPAGSAPGQAKTLEQIVRELEEQGQ